MFYAIRTSLGDDIFDNWDDCVRFRDLAPKNAKFKKFARLEDAQAFLSSPQSEVVGSGKRGSIPARHDTSPSSAPVEPEANPIPNYNWRCPCVIAYTDGSFNALLDIGAMALSSKTRMATSCRSTLGTVQIMPLHGM